MQEFYEMPTQPARISRLREAMRCAAARLKEGKGLLALVLTYLFCLVALFTLFFGYAMLAFFGQMLLPWSAPLLFGLCQGVCILAFFALILPLLTGRVRMAGLVAAGKEVSCAELFYYFSSWHLWWRSMRIALLWPLALLVPPLFSAVAIAIGNGDVSLRMALLLSTKRVPLSAVLGFWGRVLVRFALGLLTLGVLWILYDAHHTAVTYFEIVMQEKSEPNEDIA